MIFITNKEKLSKYRLWIQPAIIAVLSLVLTYEIIHNWNRPTVQEIVTLKQDNKALEAEIDSLEGERALKDQSFAELQKQYNIDSARLARTTLKMDSFKRLYLSLNKQHDAIRNHTRSLSDERLFSEWTELTR